MHENQDLVQYIVDNGIAVEICITSNLHTKAIPNIKSHPIREYLDQGVIVVPCTDNPTVSGITLTRMCFCFLYFIYFILITYR